MRNFHPRFCSVSLVISAGSALLLILGCVSLYAPVRAEENLEGNDGPAGKAACERIVSLSPSITEVLFELGLGENVVGVTRYCNYPPAAREIARVGGLLDLNYEAVLAARPKLIVALAEQAQSAKRLKGFQVIIVDHRSVSGIMDSISELGRACGSEKAAKKVSDTLERRVSQVQSMVNGAPKRRVMVAVGSNSSGNFYLSGRDGFYAELLKLAGGENVFSGSTAAIPALSAEGLLKLDPDIIMEISTAPHAAQPGSPGSRALARLSGLRAVRDGQVYVLNEDYVGIPGPRFVLLLEKLAAIFHPDLFVRTDD